MNIEIIYSGKIILEVPYFLEFIETGISIIFKLLYAALNNSSVPNPNLVCFIFCNKTKLFVFRARNPL